MKNSDEYGRKIAKVLTVADRQNIRVKESSAGSIGFVGGVRRSQTKSVDDDNPADSSKPSVN